MTVSGFLHGRYDDDHRNKPTRPALCHLTRNILGRLVFDQIFRGFDRAERHALVEEFRQEHEDCPGDPNDFLRFITVRSGETTTVDLALFVERLSALKYDAHVLLSRKTASTAYRFLVAAIGALGPVPEQNRPPKRDEDYYGAQLDLLRRSVRAFVNIFGPDCYTAYFLDPRLNRVFSLYEDTPGEDGLRFPEAITDCARRLDDLPVQLLFDEGENLIYPPFPTPTGGDPRVPDTKHAFELREGVEPKRVLAFRLTWGSSRSRAAIILNWRSTPDAGSAGEAPAEENEDAGAWMKRIWEKVDAATVDSKAEVKDKLREALRPLHLDLAVRYFIGWLSAAHIDISQQFGERLKTAPRTLIHAAASAAKEPLPAPGGAATVLIGLVRSTMDAHPELSCQCNVHWVRNQDANPERRELVFQEGNYEGSQHPYSPAFDLELSKEDGLVKQSVCAQAAAWEVSLLIRNFDRQLTPAGKTWRDLHVPRLLPGRGNSQPFGCESELAVPIFEGDGADERVIGVVNIEAKGKLKPKHMRHTELVVHLYQRLRAAYGKSKLPMKDQNVLDRIIQDDVISRSFQRLSREFCAWVLDVLAADVAFLNIFDARVRALRPVGVAMSEDNAKLFLKDEELLASVGVPKAKSKARGDDPQYTGSGSLLHRLIEHALANRLLPSSDGLADYIFRTKEGQFFPTKEYPKRFDEGTQKYAAWALALPIDQATVSISDAVLCVYWREGRQQLPGLPPFEPRKTFYKDVKERLKLVTGAIAAMYAIHRYHDPDRIGEILPSFLSPYE